MQKLYKPVRIGLIFAVLAVMLTIYVSALYRIQIHETQAADEAELEVNRVITRTVTLPAARGNIYDRNGVLLASGRPSYNISLNRAAMRATGYQTMNENILELIYITMDEGVQYTDTFPITRGAPFEYVSNMSREQRRRLDAYFEFFNLDPDISPSDLLAWMRDNYDIDYTIGIAGARLIIGVRYELEIRAIMGTLNPYVFASDVDSEFVSLVEERGFTGVTVDSTYIREYHTTHAAHLLGYIGPITPAQVERFIDELGYPRDALIGQMGAELAFENRLRGVQGRQIIRSTEDGTVISVETPTEPEPGQHVYLSMDLSLQVVVEQSLLAQIESINREREHERAAAGGDDRDEDDVLITGGAVVVTDVRTGEVLAAASYPTFNPITLSQDYAMLSTDRTRPMWNRATQGRYIPGSTFKMITAFAGLRHNVIWRYYEVIDTGRYTRYEDRGFAPTCWIFPIAGIGHGNVNVVQALECSCNYFFMYVGDRLEGGAGPGADALAAVARDFGLGISTGLEIPEDTGRLATPAWKEQARPDGEHRWFSADTVVTAFGQGDNRFTPVQLANYTATIANGGTLHALTLLRRVVSSDFSETLHSHEPVVLNVIEETEYIEIIQQGMRAVSRGNDGTARQVFRDYHIPVASKTGTAQVEGRDINDGIFVCYAPANDPEIAIAIVVEKGGSGSAVMEIARMIFDYYFRTESTVIATPYGELIP